MLGSRLWGHASESGPFNQGCGHRGGLRLKAVPTGDWTPPSGTRASKEQHKPPLDRGTEMGHIHSHVHLKTLAGPTRCTLLCWSRL